MTSTLGPFILALLHGVAGTVPSTNLPAAPNSAVIAVLIPRVANNSMLDALTRLRGEAASVGFEIRLVERPGEMAPIGQLDVVAREIAPAAVVALVENPDGQRPADSPLGAIDVWFLDRSTGKTSVGHLTVDLDAGDRAEVALAVRVVDFIRARMFDSLVRTQTVTKDKPQPAAAYANEGRRYVAAGFVGTGSFAGFSPALLPFLEAGYRIRPWLRLALGLGVFGTQPRRALPSAGSATMDEILGVASVSVMAPPRWRLVPYVQSGASVFYVAVHGNASSGYLGHDRTAWSPGWFGAAGIAVILSAHVVLQASGGAMLLLREPKVVIAEVEIARTGRPAWLGNTLLGVTF